MLENVPNSQPKHPVSRMEKRLTAAEIERVQRFQYEAGQQGSSAFRAGRWLGAFLFSVVNVLHLRRLVVPLVIRIARRRGII